MYNIYVSLKQIISIYKFFIEYINPLGDILEISYISLYYI